MLILVDFDRKWCQKINTINLSIQVALAYKSHSSTIDIIGAPYLIKNDTNMKLVFPHCYNFLTHNWGIIQKWITYLNQESISNFLIFSKGYFQEIDYLRKKLALQQSVAKDKKKMPEQ